MDTVEKVYCTGHDNNDALVAALASKNNCDPMAVAFQTWSSMTPQYNNC